MVRTFTREQWQAIVGELDLSGMTRQAALRLGNISSEDGLVEAVAHPDDRPLFEAATVAKIERALTARWGFQADLRILF